MMRSLNLGQTHGLNGKIHGIAWSLRKSMSIAMGMSTGMSITQAHAMTAIAKNKIATVIVMALSVVRVSAITAIMTTIMIDEVHSMHAVVRQL
jgi:hypothetical protein